MAEARGPVLGIDLGTTNSVVAIADGSEVRVLADETGNHLIPSVVSFHPDGRILVGREARERRLIDAENTVYSTKRLIGRPFLSPEVQRARQRLAFTLQASKNTGVEVKTRSGSYALPEISAMVLRYLRTLAEERLGVTCDRAVVTVPANFNELQRSATAAACKVAGLEVLRILNEPTAATLAYGYGREESGSVLVYDLGGGTFDVTVLDIDQQALEVVSTAGDTFLGGDDVDIALAERLSEQCIREHGIDPRSDPQAFERIRAAAEWAKCKLSDGPRCEVTLEDLSVSSSPGRDVSFTVTKDELEALARPLVGRTFEVVNEALRACGRRPKEIQHVVLVGGSTRMPLVVKLVAEFFGRMPRFERDPDLVVAQGAAIQGWMLGGRSGVAPRTAIARVAIRRPVVVRPVEVVRPAQPAFAPDRRAPTFADDRPALHIEEHSLEPDAAMPRRGLVPPPSALGKLDQLDAVDDAPAALPEPKPGWKKQTAGGVGAPIPAPSALEGDAPFASVAGFKVPADLRQPVSTGPQPPAQTRSDEIFFVEPSALNVIPPGAAPPPPPPSFRRTGVEAPPPGTAPSVRAAAPPVPVTAPPIPVAALPPAMAPVAAPPAPAWELPSFPPSAPPAPPRPAPIAGPVLQPAFAMTMQAAPILMDVTPLALGIETVSGYCQHLIARNAPVPTEKTRVFVTGKDDQTAVEIRVCQGDSNTFAQNEALGAVVLDALAQKKRGDVKIEVTFLIDASGILDVRAVEVETRREQRTRIALRGGLDAAEIDAMRRRQDQEMAGGSGAP